MARIWLLLVVLVVVVRLPVLVTAGAERAAINGEAIGRVLTEPEWQRITRASGISEALAAAIRAAVPDDGRLVIYSSYGGTEFEQDPQDIRGEPARQVRTVYERVKNLLYPNPRDTRFARDPAELLDWISAAFDGRLAVLEGRITALDGGDAAATLTVGGDYELLHEEPIGVVGRLRLWRLREAK